MDHLSMPKLCILLLNGGWILFIFFIILIYIYIHTKLYFRLSFECLGDTFNKQASFIKGIKFQKDFHKTLL